MGMLYRRKKKDPKSGKLVEVGPWWMKYYDQGKPYFQSTRKYKKREAEAVLTKAMGAVNDGQREGAQIHRTRFEDLIALLELDYQLKARKTWSRRLQHIEHLRKSFGRMRVKSITSDRIQHYITRRQREGVANGTINRELECLHRMLVLGSRCTPPKCGPPPHFSKLREDNVREGFFEHDEFLALRGAAADHLKLAMTIAYYTGMRQGEIIGVNGLKWEEHVNLEEGTIRLAIKDTKTKIARVIYMTGDFLLVMMKMKQVRDQHYLACPYVCHLRGQPIKQMKRSWKTACQRVGLEGKTFHDLRRTGVRNLVRAGVPETVAMKISGHKTRSVFDRYNITSEEDLKQAATRLGDYISSKKVTVLVTPGRKRTF
jgi:integrase